MNSSCSDVQIDVVHDDLMMKIKVFENRNGFKSICLLTYGLQWAQKACKIKLH